METTEKTNAKAKSPFQNEVVSRVRLLRIEKVYSQQKLAEVLDATNGQIGNIESMNHSHKYTLSQLSMLSKEFGVSINYIFTGKDTCTQDELIDAIVKYEERK